MINLKKFCRQKGGYWSKYDIDDTFIFNGYEYATNGFSIVRIKSDLPDTEGNIVPKVSKFFHSLWKNISIDYGFDVSSATYTCKVCEGNKKVIDKCLQCGGDGICICDCGDEHSCGTCEGIESKILIECPGCDGEGSLITYDHIPIGDYHYSGEYIELCQKELPGFKVSGVKSDGTLKFKFDGGDGILMKINI